MSEDKDWKIMLKELQADLVAKDEIDRQDYKRALIWQSRLLKVFNGKAANRILPRVTCAARAEFQVAVMRAEELVDEIVDKISRKELDFGELGMIDATSRSLPWINPAFAKLLRPAGRDARAAMHLMAEENSLLHERQYNEIAQKELAVFSRFLSQNPAIASILWEATTCEGDNIDAIGERLSRIVTPNEIRFIAREVNSMLRNTCPSALVNVFESVKPAFKDIPEELRRDEHHNFYCELSASPRPRDLVRKYGEPPAAAKPSASPA